MSHNVFVYGTLKKGEGNHRLMSMSEGVLLYSPAESYPNYTMYDLGGFPAVVHGGTSCIRGEVYKVKTLDLLDDLEGHPTFYCREQVPIIGWPHHIITCWMYVYTRGNVLNAERNITKVEDGYWQRKRQQRFAT